MKKIVAAIAVLAFVAHAHVASALLCIHVPAGKAEASDSNQTLATIRDTASTGTAAGRRVVDYTNTGGGFVTMSYRFNAPGNEWTASANNNQLIPRATFSCGATGNVHFLFACSANTAAVTWSSGANSIPQITGAEGVAIDELYVDLVANATFRDTTSSSALAVFDVQTNASCSGTRCQGTELTCNVTRDNSIGSNAADKCTLTNLDFCF